MHPVASIVTLLSCKDSRILEVVAKLSRIVLSNLIFKFDMTWCGQDGMNGVCQINEEMIILVPLYDFINDVEARDLCAVLWCT